MNPILQSPWHIPSDDLGAVVEVGDLCGAQLLPSILVWWLADQEIVLLQPSVEGSVKPCSTFPATKKGYPDDEAREFGKHLESLALSLWSANP